MPYPGPLVPGSLSSSASNSVGTESPGEIRACRAHDACQRPTQQRVGYKTSCIWIPHRLTIASSSTKRNSSMMRSSLAEALHIDPERLPTLDFARVVHNAPEWIRASPVFAMEGFQDTTPGGKTSSLTSGQIVHQFIMITVHLRGNQPGQWQWTYIRIDFVDQPFPAGQQLATLADDHEGLRAQSRGLGRVAGKGQPLENGPSLEDIASLLEAVHKRTLGGYNCFGRNCLWLTENLLLATARRHSKHWLSGFCHPNSLTQYLRGECDAITCISGMTYGHRGHVAQAMVGIGMRAWRTAAIIATHSGPKQIETHEEDLRLILAEWETRPHVEARLIY